MQQASYRFEHYIDPNFPLYVSNPQNKVLLASHHYHKAAELILVTEGEVQVMSGTSLLTCRQGDIIFIPPYSVHEVQALTAKAHIRGIIFEFSLLEHPALRTDFRDLFHSYARYYPVITPAESCYPMLQDAFLHLLQAYDTLAEYVPSMTDRALSTEDKLRLSSYLFLILSCLLQAFQLESQAEDKQQARLRPVFQYMEAHFTEKIRISDLSAILYTCEDRLIRLFKEVTGETPTEYIMNMRVEAALKLLSSTDLSVGEIAEQTGFGNSNYMSRIFRKKLFRTPGSYRKPHP